MPGGAFLLSLATTVPEFRHDQGRLAQDLPLALGLAAERVSWFRKVCQATMIDERFSVFPEMSDAIPVMSLGERNTLYRDEAPKLAQRAAEAALSEWGGRREQITHVISVSCTGVMAPGIEAHLVGALGLRATVDRLGINLMGCFGAFNGLSIARSLAGEHPDHRVLLVCTELCSLHLQGSEHDDTLVANALFADGSAACVVGADPRDGERPLWRIATRASLIVPDSQHDMTWEAGDRGFIMRMTRDVPKEIRNSIRDFAEGLTRDYPPLQELAWAVHPGGKAILHSVQLACGLARRHTQASWDVLARYGNMSSPTVLFVLQRVRELHPASTQPCVLLGFGPGLSLEGAVLERLS